MQQRKKQEEPRKIVKSLMHRNVTQFRHLLSSNYITENDLNWTMGLRDNSIPKNIPSSQSKAPQVFFKKTALSTIRDQIKTKQKAITINASQFDQMISKVLEKSPQKQTQNQIKFYNTLRKNKNNDKALSLKSIKPFDNTPYYQKTSQPLFIKKEFIKKVGKLLKQQVQSGYDGAQNQQPYSNKLRTKNYGFFEPLARAKGRGKVTLPVLAWEMGLRNY